MSDGSEVEPGVLYVVPTPLGHLGDISPRAAAVLGDVDVIAAEDTRVTRTLTKHLGVRGHLVSYHDHNETQRAASLVRQLAEGRSVALVSDAGTPLISDPGFELVRAALEAGIRVVPLPGPCAATTALSAAGLPTHRFAFLGFLPRAEGKRRAALEAVRSWDATLVLYEAPHRLVATLTDALDILGDRPAALAGSLTKRHEQYVRGPLSACIAELQAEEAVRGEWTVMIGTHQARDTTWPDAALALVAELAATPLPAKQIRDVVARVFGVPKGEVYAAVLAARGG